MKAIKILLPVLIITVFSCAPSRFVKPLKKGESAIGFNAGGPLIHFSGNVIPVPFSSVYYGYGLSEKGTVSGGFHITSMMYKTFQIDLGYTNQLFYQKNLMPGVSFYGGINSMYGFRKNDFRIYPSLDINAFWDYDNDKMMSYVGLSNWFDPHPGKVEEGSEYRLWRASFLLGQNFRFGSYELELEYKFLGIGLDNTKTVVDYATKFNTGAHGIYFQIMKKF
ncbi:MAG TPA: hypothetical protein ENK91_08920 [Bacteroidetes bacterium]|nr:hypothetical protein [Bacteroidota bacterium]